MKPKDAQKIIRRLSRVIHLQQKAATELSNLEIEFPKLAETSDLESGWTIKMWLDHSIIKTAQEAEAKFREIFPET